MDQRLHDLRRRLAAIEAGRGEAGGASAGRRAGPQAAFPDDGGAAGEAAGGFSLGHPDLDRRLGLLPAGALYEVVAASQADGAAACGFALALLLRATAGADAAGPSRAVLVRQAFAAAEIGEIHAPGLRSFGAEPERLLLMRARDGLAALQGGLEALRTRGVAGVAIEVWGAPRALDLDATRRLSFAAGRAGASVLLVRLGAEAGPSAAHARWRVASGPSQSLGADAPGHPVFEIELLRHRAGIPPRRWRVEWSRDDLAFREPTLSRPVAAVPFDRPADERSAPLQRRAG